MNAKELRIGNLLWYDLGKDPKSHRTVRVIEINLKEVVVSDGDLKIGLFHNQLKGVNLTPDWLERAGFEKQPTTKWHGNGYDYRPKDSWTEQDDYLHSESIFIVRVERWYFKDELNSEHMEFHMVDGWYPKVDNSCNVLGDVEYIHQLQNLYYALTGQELTFKNETANKLD